MGTSGRSREAVLLAIEEELDVDSARSAEARMMSHPGRGGRLVLDLSRVARFDFSGIIVLLDALAKLRDRFEDVSILGLSERVGEIFLALRPPAVQWISVNHPEPNSRRWS